MPRCAIGKHRATPSGASLLVLSLLGTSSARAETIAVPEIPREATTKATGQLARVNEALAADRTTSLRWYLGWSSLFLTSAAVRAGLVLGAHDRDLVAESRVVLVTSLLGLLTTVPMPPASLGTDEAPGEGASEDERRAYAERRRRRLDRAADIEELGRSPLAHFGGIVVNVSAGLYLWKIDHLPRAGMLTALTGIVVSEAKIATQPMRAWRAARAERTWALVPTVTPRGGGLTLVGAF